MKKLPLILALLIGLAMTSLTATAYAGSKKETTVTGTALCARCALHISKTCHTVVKTTKNGKTTIYWLNGEKARAFHHNICTKTAGEKVTVTGTMTTKDGKKMIQVDSIKKDAA